MLTCQDTIPSHGYSWDLKLGPIDSKAPLDLKGFFFNNDNYND